MIIVEPSFNQLETNNLSVSTIESSFDNFSQSIEQGVYTTFRTYKNNFVIDYESQINRLIESASLENKKIKLDPFQIRTNAFHKFLVSCFVWRRSIGFFLRFL